MAYLVDSEFVCSVSRSVSLSPSIYSYYCAYVLSFSCLFSDVLPNSSSFLPSSLPPSLSSCVLPPSRFLPACLAAGRPVSYPPVRLKRCVSSMVTGMGDRDVMRCDVMTCDAMFCVCFCAWLDSRARRRPEAACSRSSMGTAGRATARPGATVAREANKNICCLNRLID